VDGMVQTKCESVVQLHEYMHRDVYDTHQLRILDDVQLSMMLYFKPCCMQNISWFSSLALWNCGCCIHCHIS